MKNKRKGKAQVWTSHTIQKMRRNLTSSQQRLIFEIGLFTGERIGAIVQLKVADVYAANGKVLENITFASNTRKSTKHGTATTRQVAVHADLLLFLEQYTPPESGFLFPSNAESGHITVSGVDKCWRKIFNRLAIKGFSTHSSRRWVINSLRSSGISAITIAETMGMNIQTVYHYLDENPDECKKAIATLTV